MARRAHPLMSMMWKWSTRSLYWKVGIYTHELVSLRGLLCPLSTIISPSLKRSPVLWLLTSSLTSLEAPSLLRSLILSWVIGREGSLDFKWDPSSDDLFLSPLKMVHLVVEWEFMFLELPSSPLFRKRTSVVRRGEEAGPHAFPHAAVFQVQQASEQLGNSLEMHFFFLSLSL